VIRRNRAARALLVLMLLMAWRPLVAAGAEHDHPGPTVLAPGYADLEFVPPVPGSYELPPFAHAADARLLDRKGDWVSLHDLFADQLVLLSFVYTRCSDVNGCPLATHVLGKLQEKLITEADLSGQLTMISISFDPAYDNSEVMSRYADAFARKDTPWHFLTTPDESTLEPVLNAYDQWVVRDYDEDGRYLGSISHLLRVYLIDRRQRIRNIYNVSFLHADTIANDVRTLLLEEEKLLQKPDRS
jgi:cytochrome c peroxidase